LKEVGGIIGADPDRLASSERTRIGRLKMCIVTGVVKKHA
jgi:hypothetical protein